jgi:hypothetical protein
MNKKDTANNNASDPKFNNKLDAALRLARKGIPVFPLKPNTKEPIYKGGFRIATTDEAQIKKRWTKHPRANIGIAAPELLVIDVDDTEYFAKHLKPKLFGDYVPAEIPVVRTPKGGFHYYLKVEPEWARKWGVGNNIRLWRGTDLKGCGSGFSVGPGSEIDGKQYTMAGTWKEFPRMDQIPFASEQTLRAIEEVTQAKPAKRSKPTGKCHARCAGIAIGKADINLVELEQRVLRVWRKGRRQLLALAISGLLRKYGCDQETVSGLIERVAEAADEEIGKRLLAVRDTFSKDVGEIAGFSLLNQEEMRELSPVLPSLK